MAATVSFEVRTSEPDKLYDELVKIWPYIEMEDLDWDDEPDYPYNWVYDIPVSGGKSMEGAIRIGMYLAQSGLPFDLDDVD